MKLNKITGTITAALAVLTSWLGALAVPIYILFFFNVFDYLTGIAAAKYRGKEVSSYYGMMGIVKKVFMYLLVFMTVGLEIIAKYAVSSIGIEWKLPYIGGAIVAIWLVLNESISILENLNDMNAYIPPFLLPFVKRLKSQIEDTAKVESDTEPDEIPVADLEKEDTDETERN